MQPVHNYSRSGVTAPEKVRPVRFMETLQSERDVLPFPVSLRKQGKGSEQNFVIGTPLDAQPVEEQLFVALADAKIWTSRVAMHLDRETRDRLFRQLDALHDAEEWSEGDRPVSLSSYKSLVRAIIYHKINRRPAMALMPSGNLLALWSDGQDKLTIEFLPENRTKWLVQNHTDDGPERTAGTAPLERLRNVLAPYGAERWFDAT